MDDQPSGGSGLPPTPGVGTSFRLVRDTPSPDRETEGVLSFGDQTLFTLERPWLGNAEGISCIPEGEYPVALMFSPHFNREMPHLLGVPDRSDILIHWGNFVENTHGCILVGTTRLNGDVLNSVRAFGIFWEWFEPLAKSGPVSLAISSTRNWSA